MVEFRGLTLEQQIKQCGTMGAEAETFAAVSLHKRDTYLELSAQWSKLVEEMRAYYSSPVR
jgi:hypothetical protein